MYGLSAEADIWQKHLDSDHTIVLASMGCGILLGGQALGGALHAHQNGKSPSESLEAGLHGTNTRVK